VLGTLDLPFEQFSQKLDSEVPVRHALHFRKELIREDRNVGLLESGRREDVNNLIRVHRTRDKLADRQIKLFRTLLLVVPIRSFCNSGSDSLEEGNIVPNLYGLLMRDR